ncbi:MAG: hypothetical protein ACRCZO_16550, partial [Cetobacterium sp.]
AESHKRAASRPQPEEQETEIDSVHPHPSIHRQKTQNMLNIYDTVQKFGVSKTFFEGSLLLTKAVFI